MPSRRCWPEDEQVVRHTLTALLERLRAEAGPLPFTPAQTARWIERLLDACYLSAGDDDFDAGTAAAELRIMINWLLGRSDRR